MALKLDYEFKNAELLARALTQSGADAENNNERLEFLGDRVLGLAAAEMLAEMFPAEAEGALAQRHATLVSTATLDQVASTIDLLPNIKHTHLTASKTRNITADALEAVLGAIYLDGGFDPARRIVRELFMPVAATYSAPPKDAKTELQELTQRTFGALPEYEFSASAGPSHNPEFVAIVRAGGRSATGRGSSKKAATTAAAAEMLKILK